MLRRWTKDVPVLYSSPSSHVADMAQKWTVDSLALCFSFKIFLFVFKKVILKLMDE